MLMRTPPEELPERPRRRQREAVPYGLAVSIALITLAMLIAVFAVDLGHMHTPIAGNGPSAIVQHIE